MRTRSRDDFTTIRTEGQILPPDLLTRIVERDKEQYVLVTSTCPASTR